MDASPRGETPVPGGLRLSPRPIDQRNLFLYHKTTARAVYDAAYAQLVRMSDDVLLWNEQGQVTETTIANVVLRLRWPVGDAAGLLRAAGRRVSRTSAGPGRDLRGRGYARGVGSGRRFGVYQRGAEVDAGANSGLGLGS